MIYQAFQVQKSVFDLMRPFASMMATTLRFPWPGGVISHIVSKMAAQLDVFVDLRIGETRPPFGIKPIPIGNRLLTVEEEVAAATPFASLLHFKKDIGPRSRACWSSLRCQAISRRC